MKTILVANIENEEYNSSFKTCFGMSVMWAHIYIYIYVMWVIWVICDVGDAGDI